MGRLPDFGEDGAAAATVVEAGSKDDPFTTVSEPAQPTVSSQEGASGSEPSGAPVESPPAPASVPQPPVSPTPPPSPDQTSMSDQLDSPGESDTAVSDDNADDIQKLATFRTQLLDELRGEMSEGHEEELRRQQGGQDRVIAGLRSQQQEADQRYDTMQSELREVKLNGLPPEQQTRLREQWTSDDQTTKLDAYKNELEQYHLELDDFRLISTYGQFGVTEEILTQVPADERESFCESVRADYWEEQAQQQPAANQQPPPQQQPTAPVPAGASAPSDTGGNPLPSKPDEPNSSKGQGAMADNISRSDSWERTAFPAHRS